VVNLFCQQGTDQRSRTNKLVLCVDRVLRV